MKLLKNMILSVVVVGLFFSTGLAQEKIHWDVVQKIRDEGFNNSQVMDIVRNMTDVYGPRLSGSPYLREAQEWARDQLKEWGMSKAALEEWGEFGMGWTNEYTSVHMTSPRYMPIIAYPKAWTSGTNGKVTGKPVVAVITTQDELESFRGKLKGKIVLSVVPRQVEPGFAADAKRHSNEDLFNMEQTSIMPAANRGGRGGRGGQAGVRRDRLRQFYLEEGVAAVLDISYKGDDGTVFVSGGGSRNPEDPRAVAQLTLTPEHYNRLYRLAEAGKDVQMEMDVRNTFHAEDLKEYNVVAEIPGTDLAHEIVMVGAHYDSWHAGTGATDNASGSAVAMEAMRILKAIGIAPRRTIRIGLWSGEEQGLHGSRQYVNKHFANFERQGRRTVVTKTLSDFDNFSGYFNMDNGTGQFRGVSLQGNAMVKPIFEAWMKPFHDLNMKTLSMRSVGGTDHLAFDAVGLPGWQFIQDRIQYSTKTHHSNMDVFDNLIEEDLRKNSVIMASFLYHTAMRDKKLPRKEAPVNR